MKPLEAIRCTHSSCPCECFAPGKACLRYCDTCNHGWVAHALDKLGYQHAFNLGMQVEVVQPNIVFDIASLMLYGAQATPVRLKILLDRLFSVLQHEEVLQVLHGFGWSYEDYARGYILQDSTGHVLDKWSMATREEEHVILQQFLRFGETKAIAQEIILQDTRDKQDAFSKQATRAESEIKKFIERSNLTMQSFMKMEPRQLFGGRLPFISAVPGARILSSPIIPPTPFSPSRDNNVRPLSLTTSPAASTSAPLATPPMSRIQTLQPYELRRELANSTSPAASPNVPEKVASVVPTPTSITAVVSAVAAAACTTVAARRSPIESPRNLSTTPSSVHSTPSPVTPHRVQAPDSDLSADASFSGDSDDEQTMGAIDYSTREGADSPQELERKAAARHMRKSNNPIKRQWIPSANFGSTFVGPNGKKRVLCTACNKTFCDKGALKIHYSAVHLKEMHKCTVEGCSMMFSSRRSRNRHSANPNPKLHMPQKRKDLPEGVSLLGEERPKSCSLNSSLSNSPSMVVGPTLVAAHRPPVGPIESGGLLRTDPNYFLELGAQFPFSLPPPEKRIKMESQDAPTDLSSSANSTDKAKSSESKAPEQEPQQEKALPLLVEQIHKDPKDNSGTIESEAENLVTDEDGIKADGSAQRGGNRRKNNAPTRCAQKEESIGLSDDNSDDKEPGSKTTPSGRIRTRTPRNSRGEGERRTDSAAVNADTNGGGSYDAREESQEPVVDSGPVSTEKKSRGALNFPQIASLLLGSKESRDPDDEDSEKELVINGDVEVEDDNTMSDENVNGEESSNDHNHNNLSRRLEQAEDDGDSYDSEALSPGSDNAESSMSCDGSNEVYVDKENSRKCALCGKLFQNQFSVKVHFQNVHLKLMHGCTVDGCNAAFPSKRSRDRHSSNLNLHRKMLSGSDAGLDSKTDPTLRDDILSTLYGVSHLNNDQLAISTNLLNGQETKFGTDHLAHSVSAVSGSATDTRIYSRSSMESENEENIEENVARKENGTFCLSNGYKKEKDEMGKEDDEGEEEGEDDEDEEESDTQENSTVHGYRLEEVTISRKPVCCGMTFHTEAALKEHYKLRHPTQGPKLALPAPDMLLPARRQRSRPRHKIVQPSYILSNGRKTALS